MLRAAGRLADGWLPIFTDPAEYGDAPSPRFAARGDAGRAPEDITAGLFAWIVVDEDREAAERMLDTLLLRLVALTAPAEDFIRAGGEPPLAEGWGLLHYVPTRLGRDEALRLAAAVPAELLRSYYIVGHARRHRRAPAGLPRGRARARVLLQRHRPRRHDQGGRLDGAPHATSCTGCAACPDPRTRIVPAVTSGRPSLLGGVLRDRDR